MKEIRYRDTEASKNAHQKEDQYMNNKVGYETIFTIQVFFLSNVLKMLTFLTA